MYREYPKIVRTRLDDIVLHLQCLHPNGSPETLQIKKKKIKKVPISYTEDTSSSNFRTATQENKVKFHNRFKTGSEEYHFPVGAWNLDMQNVKCFKIRLQTEGVSAFPL